MTCAVAFDIDHTLAIDNKLERIAFLRLLDAIDEDGGAPLGTLDEETNAIDVLLERQRGGAFTIQEAVRRFVTERGVAEARPYEEQFCAIVLSLVDQIVVPVPGASRLLEQLRSKGIVTGVLSNGWNPLQQRKAERAGFAGKVVASADVGASKPDPRAFAALVDQLGVRARAAWYVGDNPRSDVIGARAAGLRTIWYNAEGRTYPPELSPPDATVHRLEDVVDIVAASEMVR